MPLYAHFSVRLDGAVLFRVGLRVAGGASGVASEQGRLESGVESVEARSSAVRGGSGWSLRSAEVSSPAVVEWRS